MVEQEVSFGKEGALQFASDLEECSPDTQHIVLSQECEKRKSLTERVLRRRRSTTEMMRSFQAISPAMSSRKLVPRKKESRLACEYFRAFCVLILLTDLQIIPVVGAICYVLLSDESDCGLWMRTWLIFFLSSHLFVIFLQIIGSILVYLNVDVRKSVKWIIGTAIILVAGLIVVLLLLGILLVVNESNCADKWREGYILTLVLVILYTIEILLFFGYITKRLPEH